MQWRSTSSCTASSETAFRCVAHVFLFLGPFSGLTRPEQMMRDRGYIIPQEFDKEAMTKEVFMTRYANDQGEVELELLKMRFVHQMERHKILVMFERNAKVGKKEVERLCERMGEDKRCVLVLDGNVSAPARIQIESMAPDIVIEVFREEQLLVNITEHRLVPLHQPLTKAQKEAVLARYRVTEKQVI